MLGRIAFALTMLLAGATAASAQVAGRSFVSLDGLMHHQFKATGDYLGKVDGLNVPVEGVFREAPGVCWLNKDDGTRQNGDVLLYIGEVQCCLSTEAISDKVAFTEVWVQGTGNGYRMCKNQVFKPEP
jgi:hypothetical protein